MGVVGVTVLVDGKLVKKGLQDLTAEIPKIGTNQIYQVVLRSRTVMRKKVRKPSRPIRWSSIKQKIKVLIILRYALHQMPYQRTDTFRNNFVIEKLKQGYTLGNMSDRASYLVGDEKGEGQILMAQGRYPVMRKVIDNEMQKLPPAVVAHIQLVAKEKGFESGNG